MDHPHNLHMLCFTRILRQVRNHVANRFKPARVRIEHRLMGFYHVLLEKFGLIFC